MSTIHATIVYSDDHPEPGEIEAPVVLPAVPRRGDRLHYTWADDSPRQFLVEGVTWHCCEKGGRQRRNAALLSDRRRR